MHINNNYETQEDENEIDPFGIVLSVAMKLVNNDISPFEVAGVLEAAKKTLLDNHISLIVKDMEKEGCD